MYGEVRAPESQWEAAGTFRHRLPSIDIEPEGTKPNCRKNPQPGSPTPGSLFNNARNKVALRFGHVRSAADSGSADKAVRAFANFSLLSNRSKWLRLKHDKVRNEFDAHSLVQHQVPRL